MIFFNRLTPQQFGLAVDKLWFPNWAVALAGVVENLDKGALLSCWPSNPLVKSIIEHHVKLRTVLGDDNSEQEELRDERVPPYINDAVPIMHYCGPKRHTLLGSMPFTCRSWSIVHCDLFTKAEEPWNCFTLVMDTWDGFLFVTVETIKDEIVTEITKCVHVSDTPRKFVLLLVWNDFIILFLSELVFMVQNDFSHKSDLFLTLHCCKTNNLLYIWPWEGFT